MIIWLTLGRVSNLPTVWANVITGLALASTMGMGVTTPWPSLTITASSSANLNTANVFLSLLAISLAYLGGMFLNDVFDADFDASNRNDRPIANKQIGIRSVAVAAVVLLLGSLVATAAATWVSGQPITQAMFAAVALIGSIILYDAWHKNNPISPVIMGACRAMVYVTCAMIVSNTLSGSVLFAATMLGLYVIGLTYTAKQEHLNQIIHAWPLLGLLIPFLWAAKLALANPVAFIPLILLACSVGAALFFVVRRAPGDVPKAVVTLIAGMSLWDTILLLASGFPALALVAMACWVLTLTLQMWISGT